MNTRNSNNILKEFGIKHISFGKEKHALNINASKITILNGIFWSEKFEQKKLVSYQFKDGNFQNRKNSNREHLKMGEK